MALTTTGIVCLGLASILQSFWICMPKACAFCTHWIISACCILSAAFFWAAFGVWQKAFDDNTATDAIWFLLQYRVWHLNKMESWYVYEPTMGASTVVLI